MKQKLLMFTAAAVLAFAGFGCSKSATPSAGSPGKSGDNAPKTEVDKVVDELIDEGTRATDSDNPTGDTEFLDDDEGAVGDYMITSYETE